MSTKRLLHHPLELFEPAIDAHLGQAERDSADPGDLLEGAVVIEAQNDRLPQVRRQPQQPVKTLNKSHLTQSGERHRIQSYSPPEVNKGNAKKVKTVRFDDVDLERIRSAAIRHHLSEAEVIRKVVRIGLVDLPDGEDEDELLRQRKADKSQDVDGQSFLNSLKAEFSI